jgi:hypothetical protein
MPKAAQRQFLVSVSGITEYFASLSGGNVSAETADVFDGGSSTPEKVASPGRTEDITVSRPYDPERDQPLINSLRRKVGKARMTLTKQPTDGNFVPIGPPNVYSRCLLTGVTEPEVDASSGDPAAFELTFAYESVA